MERDRLFRSLDKDVFNLWPLIVRGAADLKLRWGETGGCDVFAVDEHQFFALLWIEEMHETNGHHCGGQLVAMEFEELMDMLHVGTGLDVLAGWFDPGVDVEVESVDLSVAWGIVGVVQLRPGGEIALELHPVEALHFLLSIRLYEGVEFAVGKAIEYPVI